MNNNFSEIIYFINIRKQSSQKKEYFNDLSMDINIYKEIH